MQLTTVEEWADVVGFEDWYQVSSTGRVRSLDRYVSHRNHGKMTQMFCRGRLMKLRPDEDGYLRVGIVKEGRYKLCGVHILVAQAFIPNPENKPTVNHKDGDKTNNHVSNLEWATVGENNNHAIDTGLREGTMAAARIVSKKRISKPVRCQQTGIVYQSMHEAEIDLHLFSNAVHTSIKTGKPIHGFTFELMNPEHTIEQREWLHKGGKKS